VKPTPHALLLPAALVDPAWAGAERLAHAAARPGWAALARRAAVAMQEAARLPPPAEPGHLRWLRRRFDLQPDHALAACSAIADGQPRMHWRLDPVHLLVGRDHLVLTDPARLGLDPDDAAALAEAIAPLFPEDGLTLHAQGARWYLHETDPGRVLRLRTHPMVGAVGRNIDAWLPDGDDARRWRRLVNEVQMTWFTHPVNERREAAGLPPVNSLWIEGRVPAVAVDQPLPAAWHAAAALAARPPLGAAAPPVTDTRGPLQVDERLLAAQLAGDPQGWTEAWETLDRTLFGPIARREGVWHDGADLVLAGDSGWRELAVAPGTDWRFWRRPDPASLLVEPSPDGP
jgi:hypothetical protein